MPRPERRLVREFKKAGAALRGVRERGAKLFRPLSPATPAEIANFKKRGAVIVRKGNKPVAAVFPGKRGGRAALLVLPLLAGCVLMKSGEKTGVDLPRSTRNSLNTVHLPDGQVGLSYGYGVRTGGKPSKTSTASSRSVSSQEIHGTPIVITTDTETVSRIQKNAGREVNQLDFDLGIIDGVFIEFLRRDKTTGSDVIHRFPLDLPDIKLGGRYLREHESSETTTNKAVSGQVQTEIGGVAQPPIPFGPIDVKTRLRDVRRRETFDLMFGHEFDLFGRRIDLALGPGWTKTEVVHGPLEGTKESGRRVVTGIDLRRALGGKVDLSLQHAFQDDPILRSHSLRGLLVGRIPIGRDGSIRVEGKTLTPDQKIELEKAGAQLTPSGNRWNISYRLQLDYQSIQEAADTLRTVGGIGLENLERGRGIEAFLTFDKLGRRELTFGKEFGGGLRGWWTTGNGVNFTAEFEMADRNAWQGSVNVDVGSLFNAVAGQARKLSPQRTGMTREQQGFLAKTRK